MDVPSRISLYLQFPPESNASCKTGAHGTKRQALLTTIETTLRSTIFSSTEQPTLKNELKLRICDSLSDLAPYVDLRRVGQTVAHILTASINNEQLWKAMLRIVCEQAPEAVGQLLEQESELFANFFDAQRFPDHVTAWFDHFHYKGKFEHGAVGLENFAFNYRNDAWNALVWQRKLISGKEAIPPCVAAQKRHLFASLDVLRSIDNLAHRFPFFWKSEEFRNTIRTGQFLFINLEYFIDVLYHKVCNGDTRLKEIVEQLLEREILATFRGIVRRVIILMDEREFLAFLSSLTLRKTSPKEHQLSSRKRIRADTEWSSIDTTEFEAEIERLLLLECRWTDLDQLYFLYGISSPYATLIVKLIIDEETRAGITARQQIDAALMEYGPLSSREAQLEDQREFLGLRSQLLMSLARTNSLEWARWVALETFLIRYRLTVALRSGTLTREAAEMLMKSEGVPFVAVKDVVDLSDSDLDDVVVTRYGGAVSDDDDHESGRQRRKRRRHSSRKHKKHKKVFIGWQLGETDDVVYGPSSLPAVLGCIAAHGMLSTACAKQ